MYRRENSRKNDHHHNEPSFSSTLLDEIYRSIDDNYKEDSMYFYRWGTEEIRRRGTVVDKYWMENDNHHENVVLGCTRDSSAARPKLVPDVVRRQLLEESSSSDDHDLLINKSKSRALKIYASLRKVKQPISPAGGKLTGFINSLFNIINHAKLKKVGDNYLESSSSNCSSASSYSRSCLSKNSPKSRDIIGIQRRVRFDPAVRVIESKSNGGRDHSKVPPNYNLRRLRVPKNHRKVLLVDDDDDDDDDDISDSSSDLFELDHLSLFGHTRFCQELPMYETTTHDHYGTNRAIFN
ncbi:protein BIG GRAIN 1-like A [Henckelia pumila]|uniref:protein BIG GRAIN 1-like A n=1 Tax=Henckelia pumila TaxID=405737 RepID=UPI003C6E894D